MMMKALQGYSHGMPQLHLMSYMGYTNVEICQVSLSLIFNHSCGDQNTVKRERLGSLYNLRLKIAWFC